jgi:type IV pilus assembly protein PilW
MKARSMNTRRMTDHRTGRRHSGGFTLIELLVAVTIGMGLTLAITLMLVRSESGRRAMTSISDVAGGGAYISFVLDRQLRSAGSGFTQARNTSMGCTLGVSRSGTQVLPRTGAFPVPFDSVPQAARLIPVLVHAGVGAGSSDVIAVMSGSSGLGESPMRVLPRSATGTNLRVPSTIGLRGNDLVVVMQDSNQCLLQQVDAAFVGSADQLLNFGGDYAVSSLAGIDLSEAGKLNMGVVAPIGNITGNRPNFSLIGIGANGTLFNLDLLRLDGVDAPVPIADGVADMRVLYGISAVGASTVSTWVRPDTAPWDAATLQDGSALSRANLGRIVALRVGLLLRNSAAERSDVSPPSITLFPGMGAGLQISRPLVGDERKLRWRSVDFTVPLRNAILMNGIPSP